ncbi:uncharacterized protein [Spinacia oleracea]|uniref:Reverse transcriptase domain-containing protein n=1 Tax=Spinacia oleracea TaxID=3562 RepID=A0ABM3R890_SPIOL|nr:uncharacterized protein LOC110774859 [Spinacia oleracea]
MADHVLFLDVVKKGWDVSCTRGGAMFKVWTKLKAVKQGLKELHHKDFAKLDERIEGLRADLGQIQIQLTSCPTDSNVQQSERDCSETLKKFLHIQESAYRQKARIQWLQVGDSNSKFFFSAMKERIARNSIDILYDDSLKKLSTTREIQEEVSSFYKKLIGTAASSLMGVDVGVVRNGKQLSATDAEIDAAIKGIDINKAPGLDGFNSLFFLKAWEIVKADVYEAVREFFRTGVMLKQVNNTSVTLVPKIQNASCVKDFRPIACCSVVYKIISKILQLECKVLLVQLKHVSPRCMIKVDLKKSYDSLEWPFLKTMLSELGFPMKFVNWVMQCLYSVSYSILINGCPTKPIPAKKGLRQGDPISPYLFALGMEYLSRCLAALAEDTNFSYHPRCKKLDLTHMMFADDLLMFSRADESAVKALFDAFTKFSLASGLEANLHKSEVYLAGVSDHVASSIVSSIGVPKGSFPFRYLGVPLTTRKLSFTDCKPLIDRTVARIKSWTSKFLSYADSRKASISWEKLCFPKSCGGWNLKDLTVWNKAAVLKHCWAFALKQDRLWANGVDQFVQAGKFRIQKMYKFLHPVGAQVGWKRLICNSHASPKSTFIMWLAVQNRLATKDRLIRWQLNIDGICGDLEAGSAFLGVNRTVLPWHEEVQIAVKKSRSTQKQACKYSIAFIESVYCIWLQRNAKVFRDHVDPVKTVVSNIMFNVECRCQ